MDKEILIKKYLQAELTKSEEDAFIKLLEQDNEFADDVKIQSLVYANRSKELKEFLSDADTSNFTKVQNNTRSSLYRIIRNCAAIFILAFGAYYSFNLINGEDEQDLVEEFYNEVYPSPGLLLGEEHDEDLWEQAIVHYSAKEYDKTIDQIAKIDSLTIEHRFYLSLSNMYANPSDFQTAISTLESIQALPDNMHKDATLWYLSIAYLKTNDKHKAKPILDSIANSNHFKKKEALKLLKQFVKL